MKKKSYKKTNIGKNFKIICLIPIRSKSKRIKNKNFTKINGIPLIKYVLNNIKQSKYIDKFYIASDNLGKVKKIINENNKIQLFQRSKKSSTSNAQTEIIINEFLRKKNMDILVFVQATNPFIKYTYIDSAIEMFLKNNFDSLLSVVKSKHFIWSNQKYSKPTNYNLKKRKMSQSIKGHFLENGSFYIFFRKNFLKKKNRLHGKIGTFEMPKQSMHEIDDKIDLKIVKKLLS